LRSLHASKGIIYFRIVTIIDMCSNVNHANRVYMNHGVSGMIKISVPVWLALLFLPVASGIGYAQSSESSDEDPLNWIILWGSKFFGLCNVPSPNCDFAAISGGGAHCLGLKEDGSIVAWGSNSLGQCTVPSLNADFMSIEAGGSPTYRNRIQHCRGSMLPKARWRSQAVSR